MLSAFLSFGRKRPVAELAADVAGSPDGAAEGGSAAAKPVARELDLGASSGVDHEAKRPRLEGPNNGG